MPDNAFQQIKNLINAANANANTKAQITVVSYTGTGVSGQSNPVSVSASFPIKIAIWITDFIYSSTVFMLNVINLPTSNTTNQNGFNEGTDSRNRSYAYRSSDYKTLSWWAYNDYGGLNHNGTTYSILLIG